MASWTTLNRAFAYLEKHIANKPKAQKFALSEIDLALVSNFKGGNASVAEPLDHLPKKLLAYSSALKQIDRLVKGRGLRQLDRMERRQLATTAQEFASLTDKTSDTYIFGFGPSYASALLAAHFPAAIPILDRLVLSQTGIKHSPNQVANIEQYYPALIEAFFAASMREPELSLREIDGKWFAENQARRSQDRRDLKAVKRSTASQSRVR